MLGVILLLQALTAVVSGPPASPEYLPLWVAEAEGYFAREDLNVTLRMTRAEVGAAEALAQGHADVAATSFEAMIRFGTRPTIPVPRLIFGLTAAPPAAFLAAAQAGASQSMEKLAGLRIGLTAPGAPEHTWLIGLLARAKVKPHEVQLVSLGSRGLPAALEAADVHAGLVLEPSASRLITDGKAALLADLRSPDGVAASLGHLTVNAAVFVRGTGRPNDRALAGFVRALLAAQERIKTTSPAILAGRLPARVVGPLEDFPNRLAATREVYLREGRVTADQVRETLALTRAYQPLPARLTVPRAEDLLYQEPLRRALASPAR